MTKKDINRFLQEAGFSKAINREGVYLVASKFFINPAFFPVIVKRKGGVRIGGGVGFFSEEFEKIWRENYNEGGLRMDNPLPMTLIIDNFVNEMPESVFIYDRDVESIRKSAINIFKFIKTFPLSEGDLIKCIRSNDIGGKSFSDFLNIASYFALDNVYQKKEIFFLEWLCHRSSEISREVQERLSAEQRKIIFGVTVAGALTSKLT